MKKDILENLKIEKITKDFLKAPHKKNEIHEADAELIDFGKESEKYLAITTDSLVEEVTTGLYNDPYLIGWMLAMVNFSDLAAVGAEPLGLLVSVSFPSTQDEAFMARLAEGISDACKRLNTFVLGGDTNQGNELFLSGCAVGLVPKKSAITRIGVKPKDKLYLSGPGGLGNIYAFLRLFEKDYKMPEFLYKPVARIAEGKIVREFGSCCMDTSDGLLHTLDTLMRLNHNKFILNNDWERILHPVVQQVCIAQSLPPWLALAAVHGEFELCFTISPQNEKKFLQKAALNGWMPILIGEVAGGEGVSIKTREKLISLNTTLIRNLSETAGSDPQGYIKELLHIAQAAGIW